MGRNKPISEDLRARVFKMYRAGFTAAEAATHFGVCQRNVYRRDAIEKERGTLASGHARSGRKSKIVADERREEFAKATATKTLQAMADYWNGQAEQQVSQILDNARFHKFKRLRIIAKAHGITLLF